MGIKAPQPLSHFPFHEDTKQKLLQRLRQEVSGSLGAQGQSADVNSTGREGELKSSSGLKTTSNLCMVCSKRLFSCHWLK
jgi:hypothetical protein